MYECEEEEQELEGKGICPVEAIPARRGKRSLTSILENASIHP